MHAPAYTQNDFTPATTTQPSRGLARKGLLAAAVGLGAYLLSPSSGSQRRTYLRDKLSEFASSGTAAASQFGSQLRERASATAEQAGSYAESSGLQDFIRQYTGTAARTSPLTRTLGGGLGTAALLYGMRRFGPLRAAAAIG